MTTIKITATEKFDVIESNEKSWHMNNEHQFNNKLNNINGNHDIHSLVELPVGV